MTDQEGRIATRFEQFPAAQREAAIADVATVIELRPERADIIISQKIRIPLVGIEYETVPLDDKAMGRPDMVGKAVEHEFRIVAR